MSAPPTTPAAKTEKAARGPGRPRDSEVERRIRAAVLQVLAENGFSGMTIEKICARAQVPRATFYRRWANPTEAVADAFNDAVVHRSLPDTGDIVQDLVQFFMNIVAHYTDPVLGPCMSFIIPEAKLRPDLLALTQRDFLERRSHNLTIVRRGIERGQVPPSVDPNMVLDVLNGLALNVYATGRKVSAPAAEQLVRRLLEPQAATSP